MTTRKKTIFFLIFYFPLFVLAQEIQTDKTVDSLLKKLSVAREDTGKVILLDRLSYRYSTTNADLGIKMGNEALVLAKKLGWQKGIAMANNELSINHKVKAEYVLALDYAQKALKIYEELGDKRGVATVTANTALIYLDQSNYPPALDYLFRALKEYEVLDDKMRIAIVTEHIGRIYVEQKNYDKAIEYYLAAYHINQQLGDRESVARNQTNIGVALESKGDYDSALVYHKAALKIFTETGNKYAVQTILENIGNICLHQQNFAEALKYQQEALKLSEEIGGKNSIAINWGNLGETYLAIASDTTHSIEFDNTTVKNRGANLQQAANYLEKAVALCREIHFSAPQLEFMQSLAEAYTELHDYQKAIATYKDYISLKDSVFSDQNKIKIATLESQRELSNKDKDLQIKENLLRIQELELSRRRYERIVYFISIGAFCIILGFILSKFFALRIVNKKLRLEKTNTEYELVNSEFRLKQAQAIAHIGNWAMNDHHSKVTTWSEEMCRIFGIPTEDNRHALGSWLSYVHPDDAASVTESFEKAQSGHSNAAFFHRIVRKDGSIRHLYSQTNYEFDASGKPLSMYGVVHDITEIKEHEEEIRRNDERFELMNKALREAIMDWDIVHDTTVWGHGFTDIFGYRTDQYHNHLLLDNIHPDDVAHVRDRLQQTLDDKTSNLFATEFRYLKANREIVHVALRSIFIRDSNGKAVRAVGSLMDITDLIEKTLALEKQNAALMEVTWIQSHVVRGPLATLMGLMDLFRQRDVYHLDEKDLDEKIELATRNLDKAIHQIVQKAESAMTAGRK